MTDFIAVARADDIPEGTTKLVKPGGRDILIVHSSGRYYAVDPLCSHADEPLACGRVKHGWIACPAHGARFDLETGEPLNPPASDPLATYAVRIADGMVEVAIA
jgi:3-phenylpropionate/trans-cinnamate dioxygenase ferredoxin subunit